MTGVEGLSVCLLTTISCNRYHSRCLKIARGKIKEEDKYTCPICDWRVKIPRDAARPKLEDLIDWYEEVATLPFQPEEEEVLKMVIDNAIDFRHHVHPLTHKPMPTNTESEAQRFFLRKIEGAEILLADETNLFRQELHRWFPVAPEAPPVREVSLSTRKPRPTKLQKILAEHKVENIEDLPTDARMRAQSLRRKQILSHDHMAAHTPPHGGGPGSYGGNRYGSRSVSSGTSPTAYGGAGSSMVSFGQHHSPHTSHRLGSPSQGGGGDYGSLRPASLGHNDAAIRDHQRRNEGMSAMHPSLLGETSPSAEALVHGVGGGDARRATGSPLNHRIAWAQWGGASSHEAASTAGPTQALASAASGHMFLDLNNEEHQRLGGGNGGSGGGHHPPPQLADSVSRP